MLLNKSDIQSIVGAVCRTRDKPGPSIVQEAPGGGGCVGACPGNVKPGGKPGNPLGIPGKLKPKFGTAGETPMLLGLRSLGSGWR